MSSSVSGARGCLEGSGRLVVCMEEAGGYQPGGGHLQRSRAGGMMLGWLGSRNIV